MKRDRSGPVHFVIGPKGTILTRADLPSPNTKRWVMRRKAEVVAAVQGGLLTLDDACSRYQLTVEEFVSWQRAVQRKTRPLRRSKAKHQKRSSRRARSRYHRVH